MSINKTVSDRLFKQPVITRDEPLVQLADIVFNTEPENLSINKEAIDTGAELNLIYNTFDSIINDYSSLIETLIKRANIRGIEMPLLDNVLSTPSVSSALYKVFNNQKTSLNFEEYVDLLIYEKQLITSKTIGELNNLPSVDDSIKYGIGQLKGLFVSYVYEKDAADLLIVNMMINKISDANSSKSAIADASILSDGTDLRSGSFDNNKKDKLSKWLNDCIPCQGRVVGIYEDFKKLQPFKLFIDTSWKKLLGDLKYLANIRLAVSGTYFTRDICRLIDELTPSKMKCLPDIVNIQNLLSMSLFRFNKLLKTEFESLNISIDSVPISVAVNAVTDSLSSILTKIVNNVFGAIDCYLTSLETQLSKIDDSVKEFYMSLKVYYDDIYSWLMGLISEINRMARQDLHIGGSITKLYIEIDKVRGWISLIQEIISVYKNYKGIIEPSEWKKMGKVICATAYGKQYPWVDVTIDPVVPDSPDDTTSNPPIGTDGETTTGKPIGGGVVIIKDKTLPTDFFDNDPLNILDNPLFKQYYNNIKFDDTLENGRDILRIDDEFTKNYQNTIKLVKPYTLIGKDYLPVRFFSFENCINADGLEDYSQEQINEWINKVK